MKLALVIDGADADLTHVGLVCIVAAGGGVSVLECMSANLTPVEVEVLAKALVESEFNVAYISPSSWIHRRSLTLSLLLSPHRLRHGMKSRPSHSAHQMQAVVQTWLRITLRRRKMVSEC